MTVKLEDLKQGVRFKHDKGYIGEVIHAEDAHTIKVKVVDARNSSWVHNGEVRNAYLNRILEVISEEKQSMDIELEVNGVIIRTNEKSFETVIKNLIKLKG